MITTFFSSPSSLICISGMVIWTAPDLLLRSMFFLAMSNKGFSSSESFILSASWYVRRFTLTIVFITWHSSIPPSEFSRILKLSARLFSFNPRA